MSSRQPGPLSPAGALGAPVESGSLPHRLRRAVLGPPRPLDDKGLFHKVSLVAVLAWVGLGADGLSSSAYGPEEAFRALGEHRYLAVALAGLMAATVFIISAAYTRIIERFPHGGGGYVVASKLLGPGAGLTSGSALLVDYILTVAISIAAAGDALFSVLPPAWAGWKIPVEATLLVAMLLVNLRGIRESVMVLAPIFFVFVGTHAVLIAAGFLAHIPEVPATAATVSTGFSEGAAALGVFGLIKLVLHAFSLGGGTYTGIEAVSNGIPMMRHPQVQTAKRTMRYMSVSLAVTATSLLLLYLLWDIRPVAGQTMNAVLVERLTQGWPLGSTFAFVTMASAAALLVVAAQAGFADGPRVLANMALDGWVPRRFASLSERLAAQNGILLVGGAAMAALLYTRGNVSHLVVMYSINVFLTFSLSMLAMTVSTLRDRGGRFFRDLALFGAGLSLCMLILTITVIEKFGAGGWLTLATTGGVMAACIATRAHYRRVQRIVAAAFTGLESPPPTAGGPPPVVDPSQPTAVMLVSGFGGLGVHTLLTALRAFPGHFRNVVFVSVGVIDSGAFKGHDSLDALARETQTSLDRYVAAANGMGLAATSHSAIGTDAIETAEHLCLKVAAEHPRSTFIAGQLVFSRDTLLHRILHNQTAFAIQRRLQWAGLTMIVLPARVQT